MPHVWSTSKFSPKKRHYISKFNADLGTDVFMINNKTLLCIVDYHSKFPIVKKVSSLSADELVQTTKLMFAEYGVLKGVVSYAGINLI